MGDIALIWRKDTFDADFSIVANDLAPDAGLQTAVLLSLFLDRRAQEGDVLPDDQTDRRGWWADQYASVEGDKIGSRLWLLSRAKQTQETLDRAADYVREALQWMVDDKVTNQIDVATSFFAPGMMGIQIKIHRPTTDAVTFKFNYNWTAQEFSS
jgi:phage gp46-like protein